MKKTFRFLFLLTIVASFLYSGCELTDENAASDDPRDAFEGEWQFIESFKSTEGQSYIVTISKDPNNSSQVLLGNFGNPGSQDITVKGIATSNQIVISSQSMSNGWRVEGIGKTANVAKSSMTWTFSITAGGSKDDYTATATR